MITITYDVTSNKPLIIGYVEETGLTKVKFENFTMYGTNTTAYLSIEGIGLIPLSDMTVEIDFTMTVNEGKSEAFLVEKNATNTYIHKSQPFEIRVKHNGRIADIAKNIQLALRDWFISIFEEIKIRLSTVESGLANEITRATTAEGVLDETIQTEKERAVEEEATLQTNIDEEKTRASSAESTLDLTKVVKPTIDPSALNQALLVSTLDPLTTKWGDVQLESKFFFCTYGTTTYAEITAALEAGKIPVVPIDGALHMYSGMAGTDYFFTRIMSMLVWIVSVNTENRWSTEGAQLENLSNKKHEIAGNEESRDYYPSTKAVADYWTAQNKFYWCTYGTTTSQDITNAVAEGKTPVCIYKTPSIDTENTVENMLFTYAGEVAAGIHSFTGINRLLVSTLFVDTNNNWTQSQWTVENTGNKKDAIVGVESSSIYYPSTKGVADYVALQNKFYWCTYGTTTFVDINNAIVDGKIPVCIYHAQSEEENYFENMLFIYGNCADNIHRFGGVSKEVVAWLTVNASNTWTANAINPQDTYYRTDDVETYKAESKRYPSTKGVADYVANQNKFYWCTYGTTTYDEVTQALAAGKTPICSYPNASEDESNPYQYQLFTYSRNDNGESYRFSSLYTSGNLISGLALKTDNTWSASSTYVECTSNRSQTIDATSTTKYPSTKAVADYVTSNVTVKDVQINGTTILSEGVANVPIATVRSFGVISSKNEFGIEVNGAGYLYTVRPSETQITNRDTYRPITPRVMDYAVKASLSDSNSLVTWSETEQKAACQRMGAVYNGQLEDYITETETENKDITIELPDCVGAIIEQTIPSGLTSTNHFFNVFNGTNHVCDAYFNAMGDSSRLFYRINVFPKNGLWDLEATYVDSKSTLYPYVKQTAQMSTQLPLTDYDCFNKISWYVFAGSELKIRIIRK